MTAIKVEKKVQLNKFEIVKYQLIHHCFMNKIRLSETELTCLALLGELGKIRLTRFAEVAVDKGILGTTHTVTSCLARLKQSGLFSIEGIGKKIIFLNPELGIQSEGTIIIELKLFKIEAEATPGNIQNHSKKAELV